MPRLGAFEIETMVKGQRIMLHSKRETLEWPDLNVLFPAIGRFAKKKDTASVEELQRDFQAKVQERSQRSKLGMPRKGSVPQFRSHSEARLAEVINSRGDLGVQRSASVEVIDKISEFDAVGPDDIVSVNLNDDSEDQKVASSGAIEIKDDSAV